jgi:hypothetical protein
MCGRRRGICGGWEVGPVDDNIKARFPQLTDAARTAKVGLDTVSRIVNDELRWMFRVNPLEHDFGIDGYLDVVAADGSVTGQSVAVQIKCGESYLREKTDLGYVFHGDTKHLNYYLNCQLPVLIVLCEPHKRICYWELFDSNKTEATPSGWKMIVPFAQTLGVRSKKALLNIVGPATDHSSALAGHWAITKLLRKADRILYAIGRQDIETGSIEGICDFFNRLLANVDLCAQVQGKVDISVSGYDYDARELWEIEEVRNWFSIAWPAVKYWFYFLSTAPASAGLKLLFVCLSDAERGKIVDAKGRPQVLLDSKKMAGLLGQNFLWLNEMTDRMRMPLEKNREISFAIMDYFEIPHDP